MFNRQMTHQNHYQVFAGGGTVNLTIWHPQTHMIMHTCQVPRGCGLLRQGIQSSLQNHAPLSPNRRGLESAGRWYLGCWFSDGSWADGKMNSLLSLYQISKSKEGPVFTMPGTCFPNVSGPCSISIWPRIWTLPRTGRWQSHLWKACPIGFLSHWAWKSAFLVHSLIWNLCCEDTQFTFSFTRQPSCSAVSPSQS